MNAYLDIPSPPGSGYPYVYGDHESYFDPSTSESQSEINSPYDMGNLFEGGSEAETNPFAVGSPPTTNDGGSPEAAPDAQAAKAPAKRKRENRYKNASPSVLSRRRAQNRASQRAYRERKDQRITDLQLLLDQAQANEARLSQALAAAYQELNKYKSNHFAAITMATAVSAPAVALPGPPPTIPGTGPVTPGESYQSFEGPVTQPDGSVLDPQTGYLYTGLNMNSFPF